MRISDWSSDVCSSDLLAADRVDRGQHLAEIPGDRDLVHWKRGAAVLDPEPGGAAREVAGHRIEDRKSVVSGKSVSVRVDLGGRRILKKKNTKHTRWTAKTHVTTP